MSYDNMDHADWVRRNIGPAKKQMGTRKPRKNRFGQTVGWAAAPDDLSPFQAAVMDILGITCGGIYNAPIVWETVEWDCGGGLSIVLRYGELATWDFRGLTDLVMLCHMARIRVSVEGDGPRMLRLTFYQRSHEGGMSRRHPDLDEAVASIKERIGPDHRIRYQPSRAPVRHSAVAEVA